MKGLFPQEWVSLFLKNPEILKELLKASKLLRNIPDRDNIVPKHNDIIFRVFKELNPQDIKVVVFGNEPYPNRDNDGLAYSCGNSLKPSTTLKNLVSKVTSPDEFVLDKYDLSRWVTQGVFLPNVSLTVEKKKPDGHAKIWHKFTSLYTELLSSEYPDIIWILLGKKAQNFKPWINENSIVLEEGHPSPTNKVKQFEGITFRIANGILIGSNKGKIRW
jgi:uracil-DNA glycosylase